MNGSPDWKPPKPVIFAWLLCLLMWGGDLAAGGSSNPLALVFYSFLPAALWMIAADSKRNAEAIIDLEARLDRLEGSHRSSTVSKAG